MVIANLHMDTSDPLPVSYKEPLTSYGPITTAPSCLTRIAHLKKMAPMAMNDINFFGKNQRELRLIFILVGGIATPLKNVNVSWEYGIRNIEKNKKCSFSRISICCYVV